MTAGLCLIAGLLITFSGYIQKAGPFFIAFFLALAIALQGFRWLKGFSYTVTIFAAVTTALYYSGHFISINGYKLTNLITPLIQVIMFGMGTSMSFHDFAGVIKMPKGVFIGVISHFIIMPLLGFALANLSACRPK